MTQGERYRAEAQRLDREAASRMSDADGLVVGVDNVPDDVQKRSDELYAEAERLYERNPKPVSYTHLTLPTICSV